MAEEWYFICERIKQFTKSQSLVFLKVILDNEVFTFLSCVVQLTAFENTHV